MVRRKNSKKFIHYKLRESYIINCGSFVLLQIGVTVIINWEKSVITAWAKCYYKLGQAFGEQLLLQIGTTIILRIKIYCKLEQVWQIRTLVHNTSFCLSFFLLDLGKLHLPWAWYIDICSIFDFLSFIIAVVNFLAF